MIKTGDRIKVSYTGKLSDGTVFDSSDTHGAPLEFTVGSGQVIKGFDAAVIGMGVGDSKEVKIPSGEAYGPHRKELIQTVPKEQVQNAPDLKKDMLVGVGMQDGAQMTAKVADVTEKEITFDLNHPLAGKDLVFTLKIEEIA